MSVGSVSKTTFYQMLPAFAIKLGSLGIGLSTRSIQEGSIAMMFEAAACFGTDAELSQPATQTNPSLGHVFPAQAHWMQLPWPHHLTSRAQVMPRQGCFRISAALKLLLVVFGESGPGGFGFLSSSAWFLGCSTSSSF